MTRPLPAVVGVALAVVVAVAAWALLRPGSTPVEDPAPVPDAAQLAADVRLQSLEELLDARAAAVLAGDREAFLATVDPTATDFREQQARVVEALAAVPLETWSYEVLGDGQELGDGRRTELGPDAWVAEVVLSYRFADVDLAEVERTQQLTLVPQGQGWLVAADSDGPTQRDLWDLGPVGVATGARTLVLGTAPVPELQQYAALGDAAAARVDAVWGRAWPRRTVLLVPGSQEEMAQILGRDDGAGLEQVAAVTTGSLGLDRAPGTTDRVIVNPAGFARLGELGRSVVLTHETTHVAARSGAAGEVPPWLGEGLADHVAYSGEAELPPRAVAAELLERVRAGTGPGALPSADDFDATRGDIGPAYSAAWLAARLVAQQYGQDRLVALHRAVSGQLATETSPRVEPVPVEVAVPQVLGVDLATFEQQWLAELSRLAVETG